MKTPIAKLKFPKITARIVWVGFYGGHYDSVVIFKSKPIISDEDYHLPEVIKGKYYDMYDNKDLAIGSMYLNCFTDLYPDLDISKMLAPNKRPKHIEPTEVFKIKLFACWDGDEPLSFDFHADGY